MNEIDLTELPVQARQELLDFYEFLKAKYSIYRQYTGTPKRKFEDFLANPIKVVGIIKYTRDNLHER